MPHFPVLERVLFDPWPPAPRIHVSSYSRIAASRVDDNGDNDVSVTNRASLFFPIIVAPRRNSYLSTDGDDTGEFRTISTFSSLR